MQQPPSLSCSSPTEIWALNSGMKVELFWPWGLSSPISPSLRSSPQGSEAIRDYGYPFSLFIFIRDLYPHKRDQMKCLPAFSTDSLRSSSSVWASFVGVSLSFSRQYPKEHMVIKTINAAFLRLFFFSLVVNYDNWIHTQMHTCTQGSHLYAGLKIEFLFLCRKQHVSPEITWSVHDERACV